MYFEQAEDSAGKKSSANFISEQLNILQSY